MNKILHLFNEQYVMNLLAKEVLPLYPDFSAVKKIKIFAHKKYIWEETYHVVIEFTTTFLTREGKLKKLPIFCSAHSDEPRKNVYDSLKFLWENGFGRGYLSIPHPLFYSKYFQGTFYRGVQGKNLYRYIKEKNYPIIESIVRKTAAWFAKLHNLPTARARNFNRENSRIETVLPGIPHILNRIKEDYPTYLDKYKKIYNIVNNREKKFLSTSDRRWLIHGDAHPENVIKMGSKKIAIIDFTDICLSDFTRDLGSFTQQLEFMFIRKTKNEQRAQAIKKIFLHSYFKNSKIKPDSDIWERINNYYYWTAIRTATYFLIKDVPEPKRAYPIIRRVSKKLGLN